MSGLEIGLLIIGAVFFIGSFFVSEKLSSSDMNEIQGLIEQEMKALLEKGLKEADTKLEESLSQKIDEKTEEFAAGADKETNNRIMSIGEYADSVFDSMNKTHEEIMFLYQMLNDKQESITQLTKTLGEAESHVRELLTEAERQKKEVLERPVAANVPDTSVFPPLPETPARPEKTAEPVEQTSDAEAEAVSELRSQDVKPSETKAGVKTKAADAVSEDQKAVREKIISMYHQGYSLLDIAKETGKGMGEVQFILDLFDEKEEDA